MILIIGAIAIILAFIVIHYDAHLVYDNTSRETYLCYRRYIRDGYRKFHKITYCKKLW